MKKSELINVPVPIDMLLFCPACHKQHIDRPDKPGICECGHEESRHRLARGNYPICETRVGPTNSECECPGFTLSTWTNPVHRSHTCRTDDGGCGTVWRPADVPTNGVANITSRGKADTWAILQKVSA